MLWLKRDIDIDLIKVQRTWKKREGENARGKGWEVLGLTPDEWKKEKQKEKKGMAGVWRKRFIVARRESTARGVWKSSDWGGGV